MKRYRTPIAKPGQLLCCYGKLPNDSPDIIYAHGEGVERCDARLLHYIFNSKQYNQVDDTWEHSFFAVLTK